MSAQVSVVTPCYNGEPFIEKYMESVLAQDYDNVQLIITDDGSQDKSLEKLKSYTVLMQQQGIEYIVLHKENGGQPSAFNCGIKQATGKYVVWPDIDDYMHPDFISKKVTYMEKHPEVDFLISQSAIVRLDKPDIVLGYTWPDSVTNNNELMDRILNDRDIWFEPGAYMARLDSMDQFIKNRKIYDECKNWSGPQTQIIMPFFYYGTIGYLDECLYDYYIHDRQDHNKLKDRDKLIYKCEEVKKMLIAVLKSLESPKEAEMLKIINERMIRTEICIAFQIEDKQWFIEAYSKFQADEIHRRDKIKYFVIKYPFLKAMFKLYRKIFPDKNIIRY